MLSFKRIITIVFAIAFVVLVCNNTQSQTYRTITGVVRDATNGTFLPYTTVGLTHTQISTVTNATGEYIITFPYLTNDTLIFSFIGYTNLKIPLDTLTGNRLDVELNFSSLILTEIQVSPITAENIIKKAIDNIPRNYADTTAQMEAFYRETVSEDQQYIEYIEALLHINKAAYNNTKAYDRVKITKGRKLDGLPQSDLWDYLYFVDGPYEMLRCDVAKYHRDFVQVVSPKHNFLNPRLFKLYNYQLLEAVNKQGDQWYVIRFSPRTKGLKGIFEGEILIEKTSLAFVSIYYTVSESRINSSWVISSDTEAALNRSGVHTRTLNFECFVSYRYYNGLWWYHYARMQYSFAFVGASRRMFSTINNTAELVVTSCRTDSITPIKRYETVRWKQALNQQLGEPDNRFWQNYNYLQIEELKGQPSDSVLYKK